MSTMVAPPEEATLEELESFTNRINRAFQELPRVTYATIAGQEVELTDMDSAIQSLVTTSKHDQLTGVENSVKHALFLLLDGTRAMTGDLDMNLHDVYLGNAIVGSHSALTARVGSALNVYHTVEWRPYQRAIGVGQWGWILRDADAGLEVYMTLLDVGGVSRLYMGPEVYVLGLLATTLKTDTIYERSLNAGVTIDSMLVKDGHILLTALGGWVAQGDLMVGGAADWSILSNGTAGQILLTDGTDPGWTTTFTADMLFSAGKKAYFEAAGAVIGTEWVGSLNDTYFDLAHGAGGGLRIRDEDNLLLTIRRVGAGAVASRAMVYTSDYLYLDGNPLIFQAGGTWIATGSSAHFDFRKPVHFAVDGTYVLLVNDYTGANKHSLILGAGWDVKLGFNGDDMIYYATGITGTAKHLFGLTGTETIVCGSLEANAGMLLEQTTITAAATLTAAHYIVLCDTDTAGAAFTVTLPAAASHAGRVYVIINTGTSGYDVTVDGNGAEEIQHAATQIVGDGQAMAIICDGVAWWVR